MATFTFVHLAHREGLRLLDLMGVKNDLGRCLGMIDVMLARGHDAPTADALAVAILTVYGRVFLGGVRNEGKVPADQILTGEELMIHRQFLDTRSKHVAHSINAMETAKLRVWLNPEERGGRKINNVNADLTMLMTLSNAGYLYLRGLCVKLVAWVGAEEALEQARLKEILGREFTLDQLYSMQAEVAQIGGMDDTAKGREGSAPSPRSVPWPVSTAPTSLLRFPGQTAGASGGRCRRPRDW